MTRLVEDRALLDGFRRGERTALAEVYREYVRPLYAMVAAGFVFESGGVPRRFAGYHEPWQAENVVQEVFARAFAPAARQSYDGLRPYRNFLFTIARNLIIDALRAGAHAPELVGGAPPDAVDEGVRSPEEQLADRQIGAALAAFVGGLAPAARALFQARFCDGLSVEESARTLGLSAHHVKRGEQRLRQRLFARLKADGYFDGYRSGRTGLLRLALLNWFVGSAR